MNRSVITTVVIGLVATSSLSYAAHNKTLAPAKAAKSAKVAAINKKSVAASKATATQAAASKASVSAPAAATSAPATSSAVRANESAVIGSTGTTTASTAQVTSAAKPSAWGLKYRTENSAGKQYISNKGTSEGAVEATDRLFLSYKLNPNTSVALVQYIGRQYNGNEGDLARPEYHGSNTKQLDLGDTYLEMVNSEIAQLGSSGIVWSAGFRAIAPTGEGSRLKGSNGALLFHNYFTKEFKTGTSVAYYASPKFSAWDDEVNISYGKDDNGNFTKAKRNPNEAFKILNGLEIGQDVVGGLSLEYDAYIVTKYFHADSKAAVEASRKQGLDMGAYAHYKFNSHFKASLGYETSDDYQADGYAPFKDSASNYYLKLEAAL